MAHFRYYFRPLPGEEAELERLARDLGVSQFNT
jgi:hypothetical protein